MPGTVPPAYSWYVQPGWAFATLAQIFARREPLGQRGNPGSLGAVWKSKMAVPLAWKLKPTFAPLWSAGGWRIGESRRLELLSPRMSAMSDVSLRR
jgi:hypothetical protein